VLFRSIGTIVVTAPNGFTLAHYAREVPLTHPLRVERAVTYQGRHVVLLQADRELSALQTQFVTLGYGFAFIVLALLLVFGWMLWGVLHRTAIVPLEREIAERERTQDALALHGRKLETANKELETFTYTVSHDLKAPLRGIDGYSRLLLDEYSDRLDDEGRQYLQNVRRAAQQMGRLIEDLLAYSRLERQEMKVGRFDPRALIDTLLAERTAEIKASGVTVSVSACEALAHPMVSADQEGLAIVLRNLLENALKFTRNTPRPLIEIGGRDEDDACILWVRDNGVGFDMQYHDKIFGIFQRLHRAEDYPGTGVGLAIVAKAMQRMGGRAWAESETGKGATFYLEIPK
jgi:light-regulated signal transduction histidine kinase (bacteriophytochrome)